MINISLKYLGFGVLLLLGLVLAFAPVDEMEHHYIPSDELITELQNENIFVQPEQLAHWLIDKDPDIQLVDIRSTGDYSKYHIPGNVHIPFEQLSDADALASIYKDKMIILASNGNTRAGQAWIILKQKGFKNVYILAGGLNNWVSVFSDPQKPADSATDDEVFTYQFRKGAGPEMMGTSVASEETDVTKNEPAPPPVRVRRQIKKKADEGC